MLVLNLCCTHEHVFEGWFASAADFESQQARSLVACPICGSSEVRRLPSAPRLNVSHLRHEGPGSERRTGGSSASSPPPADAAMSPTSADPDTTAAAAALARVQGQVMQALRHMVSQSENVGPRFAEEARRIHYGDAEARSIRGQASRADTEALAEEGIAVLPLPDLPGLKETLQ